MKMVVKINKKPILVMDDDEETKEYSWVYWCVSTIGYAMSFVLLDYVSFLFCSVHILPSTVLHILGWLAKIF